MPNLSHYLLIKFNNENGEHLITCFVMLMKPEKKGLFCDICKNGESQSSDAGAEGKRPGDNLRQGTQGNIPTL